MIQSKSKSRLVVENHILGVLFSQLHEEIVQAIKDAEEGLLNLKRARLLREADLVLDGSAHVDEGVKVETIDLTETDVEPEPLEDPSYPVGSKCRFRHTDGRWYNGQVIGLEGSDSAKISFLTPTSENMMVRTFCWSAFYLVNFSFSFL